MENCERCKVVVSNRALKRKLAEVAVSRRRMKIVKRGVVVIYRSSLKNMQVAEVEIGNSNWKKMKLTEEVVESSSC